MTTICNPALQTKPIPTCIGELTIGTIALLSANILIHIKNITTGREEIYQEASNGAGLVKVDLSDSEFSDKQSYELWITKPLEAARQTITIGASSSDTLALNFASCSENGEPFELPQATLEV